MRRRAVSAYLKRTPLPVLDAAVVICAPAWQLPGCCFAISMAQLWHAQCNAPAAVGPCEIEVGPAKRRATWQRALGVPDELEAVAISDLPVPWPD